MRPPLDGGLPKFVVLDKSRLEKKLHRSKWILTCTGYLFNDGIQRSTCAQPLRRLRRPIGQDDGSPSPTNRDERLHRRGAQVEPAVGSRGLNHGVFARDIVGRQRHSGEPLGDGTDEYISGLKQHHRKLQEHDKRLMMHARVC